MSSEIFTTSEELRSGVIVDYVWQFIAQLARRYSETHLFSLEQIHPGSSIEGLIRLNLHTRQNAISTDEPIGVLEFHIGGPYRGCLFFAKGSKAIRYPNQIKKNSFVQALASESYQDYYRFVADQLQLPRWDEKLPRANRLVVSLQFLSLVQHWLCNYQFEFRPVCGVRRHNHRIWAARATIKRNGPTDISMKN